MIFNLKSITGVLAFAMGSFFMNAQTTVCLGDNATVCAGSSVTIQDCNPGGAAGGFVLNNPTWVSLSDDSWSPVVNIGFTFNFYGVNYTQCTIGSNGLVSFNLGNAGGYCPWSLGAVAPLPNAGFAAAKNSQMPAYHDINPSVWASPNGEIMYQTVGSAPNRKFIVLYNSIMAYGGGGECTYMALVMNETANSFEFHLGYKPIAAGWNGGLAIQGSENVPGSVAHITPGRNNQQWSAIQEAKIWTPTSPANTSAYTITPMPYENYLSPTATFAWGNTQNVTTWPYNGGNLTINPVLPAPPDSIGYFLTVSAVGCSNAMGSASDTTWIIPVQSVVSASMTDDICSAGLGTVTATPVAGAPPYVYNWPALGSNNQTVTGVFAGVYTVEMIDGMGCMSTANVVVGDTPAAFAGSTTLVSCPGGNDGTAYAEMIPVIGNVTYLWNDPMAQTTQTAVGLTAGAYQCAVTSDIGCTGIVDVIVTEIPGMIGNIINQTDVTCNSGNDGMMEVNVIQGTPPYSYSWANSSSTSAIATDLWVGPQTCTVTDANGCVITINGVLSEPAPLDITFITPDTQICPEASIVLSATGSGGSSPYTFTWFENGVEIGTGSNITVDPELTNTTYCVELSEACGSPTDQECTLIYFPTPIVPSAIPDETEKCVPDSFVFYNNSSNGGEIATTYWQFDYNINHNIMTLGDDSTSHYYNMNTVGTHNLIMTITSIYGCVYSDTLFNIIEVLPSPVAEFHFSDNPATIFETTIQMQNASSSDVVSWLWISPGSTPSTSNSTHPVMTFPDDVLGVYPVTLIVETDRGCIDTVIHYMNIVDDILFYAPTAFTPDGDEHNQTWKPSIMGIDIYAFDLFVFNRWGEMVWESHDPSIGWDGTFGGKPAMVGTYVWVATVKSPYKDYRREFNGSFSIIR